MRRHSYSALVAITIAATSCRPTAPASSSAPKIAPGGDLIGLATDWAPFKGTYSVRSIICTKADQPIDCTRPLFGDATKVRVELPTVPNSSVQISFPSLPQRPSYVLNFQLNPDAGIASNFVKPSSPEAWWTAGHQQNYVQYPNREQSFRAVSRWIIGPIQGGARLVSEITRSDPMGENMTTETTQFDLSND